MSNFYALYWISCVLYIFVFVKQRFNQFVACCCCCKLLHVAVLLYLLRLLLQLAACCCCCFRSALFCFMLLMKVALFYYNLQSSHKMCHNIFFATMQFKALCLKQIFKYPLKLWKILFHNILLPFKAQKKEKLVSAKKASHVMQSK